MYNDDSPAAVTQRVRSGGDPDAAAADRVARLVLDPQGCVVSMNLPMAALAGVPIETAIGQPFWAWLAPARMGLLLKRLFQNYAFQPAQPVCFDLNWRKAGGRASAVVRIDPDGNRFVCTALDLTGSARLPLDRAYPESEFQILWRQSMDGMRLCDTAHRVVRVNQAFCDLTGRSQAELIGRPIWEIGLPEDRQAWVDLHDRLFASPGGSANGRYRIVRPDGTLLQVDACCKVFRFPGRGPLLLTIARDVTAQVNQAAELERAKTEAEVASAAKSEFLANISHELRTPLNAILGLSEVLLGSGLGSEQREHAERLRHAAEMLRNLVNDLLDFSKADARHMRLERIEFRLREAVTSAFETLRPRAAEKRLEYLLEIDESIPDSLVGDPHRLRQILLNLIGNAVKFTESGYVRVRLASAGENAARAQVAFWIEDSGIGIEPEKQVLIFEPFQQADGSTTRKYGGTGLGLTISARLVEMMEGKLQCESTPGAGSRFWFELSLPKAVATAGSSRTLSVLVVDDHPTNRELLVRLLERHGHEVTVAQTGREGVELWRSARFDLILMDLQMPEQDGIQATQRIRAEESAAGAAGRRTAPVAIVAMTANVTEEDRERCIQAGMNSFLPKPVEWKELEKVLHQVSCGALKPSPAPPADIDLALARVGGDRDLLREVAQLFLGSYEADLAAIRAAIDRTDSKALERAAHTLKGAVSNFGATEAGQLAFQLEQCGRNGDLAAAPALVRELLGAVARLRPVLENI